MISHNIYLQLRGMVFMITTKITLKAFRCVTAKAEVGALVGHGSGKAAVGSRVIVDRGLR